jgi:hypothetical protein
MENLEYKTKVEWLSYFFQCFILFYHLKKTNLIFEESDIFNLIWIKKINDDNWVTNYYKYNIYNTNYYLPNCNFLVMFNIQNYVKMENVEYYLKNDNIEKILNTYLNYIELFDINWYKKYNTWLYNNIKIL